MNGSRIRNRAADSSAQGAVTGGNFSTLHRTYLCFLNFASDLPHHLHDLRCTLYGVLLAVAGLLCFANQTRLNYWYVHSLWHLLVMGSSYYLVRGRYTFMAVVQYQPLGQFEDD